MMQVQKAFVAGHGGVEQFLFIDAYGKYVS